MSGEGSAAGNEERVPSPLAIAFIGDPNSIHVRRWTAELARRGHRVTLLVPDDQALEPGLDSQISTIPFEPYARRGPLPLGAIAARRSLGRVLRQVQPDVLHAHYLTTHGWTARLSGFHPYVVTVWGSDILVTAREGLRPRLYARLTLSAADLVTGDSRALVAAAVGAGARPGRTHLIQFGVDPTRFSPGPDPTGLRARLGLAGRRVVLSPRAVAPLYHQRVVVEALPALPDDVVVVMTRHLADPAEAAVVERRAAELGVADRLRIVPPFDHAAMVDAYRLADVVVSVPESDGTPVTVLEALAVGRPVVATDLPSLREWLVGLDPGALVPVDDVESTTAAIRRGLDLDAAARDEISRRGRELILRRGSQRENMAEMERLYRALVRSSGTTS